MTKTRLPTVTVLLMALAGCTSATPATPDGTTSSVATTSASTMPAPTPTTTSPEDQAAFNAEEILREYYRAQTDCLSDPTQANITCFDRVAITTALTVMRNALVAAQQVGSRVSGSIDVVSATRAKVDLTNRVTETPPTVPEVTFRVCVDVSKYNIVDKNGKSIVPPDRKPRSVVMVTVLNYKYPDPTRWRVGYTVPQKDATC